MISRQQLKEAMQKILRLFTDFQKKEEEIVSKAEQDFTEVKKRSEAKKLEETKQKIQQL